MEQIQIQGPQVPLFVDVVMNRLQDVMDRNAELERALSDVPRSPAVDTQRLEALEEECRQMSNKYETAYNDNLRLKEQVKQAEQERRSALDSARVLRGKHQKSAVELADLRKQLLEERETKRRTIKRETAVAQERADEERKAREQAERALAKSEASLKTLQSRTKRAGDPAFWRSLQNNVDVAVTQFEENADKSFTALRRAQHLLETRGDDDQEK